MKKQGFTLIEILVVVGIIGVLGSIILFSVSSSKSTANKAATISTIKQYITALEVYNQENGTFPPPYTGIYCLGQTSCIYRDVVSSNSDVLDSALTPLLGSLPPISDITVKSTGGHVFKGAFYNCFGRNPCTNPQLTFIELGNRKCVIGKIYPSYGPDVYSDGTYTVCQGYFYDF